MADLGEYWRDIPDLEAARRDRERLAKLRRTLRLRASAMAGIRAFFAKNDFLEVQTPVRIPTPALEDYIEAIPSGNSWLRTSPEFHLKRMLAAGYDRIYQTGPCFRRDEHGSRHLLEFTMLEWYRNGGDWLDVMEDAHDLLASVAEHCFQEAICYYQGRPVDFGCEWEILTVEQAFRQYARVELVEALEQDRFEELLCTRVEPHLGVRGRPTALTEYPLECSGLSAPMPGRPGRVERWEVYVCGLELGNACTELADPLEQERRLRQTAELRAREGRDIYALDQPFLDMIRVGLPKTAGVAIGLDRLFMILADEDDIRQVNAFAEE